MKAPTIRESWRRWHDEASVSLRPRTIEGYRHDRQAGQAVRVEVWAEAMGWLPRLERICGERGVPVYSGSGSVPVPAIRQAAARAIRAYNASIEAGASLVQTVLLSIGDLDLNGIRNIAQPFATDVEQFVADIGDTTLDVARRVVQVRRLLLTAEQVEEHIGERGRGRPSAEALRAGWPFPFTAQAEALPPHVRDQIVADAIDSAHDLDLRVQVVDAEEELHQDACEALADLL